MVATVASEEEGKPLIVRKIGIGENAETKQHIRSFLKDVRDEAVRLLTEFTDVFATSDLDLGNFNLML